MFGAELQTLSSFKTSRGRAVCTVTKGVYLSPPGEYTVCPTVTWCITWVKLLSHQARPWNRPCPKQAAKCKEHEKTIWKKKKKHTYSTRNNRPVYFYSSCALGAFVVWTVSTDTIFGLHTYGDTEILIATRSTSKILRTYRHRFVACNHNHACTCSWVCSESALLSIFSSCFGFWALGIARGWLTTSGVTSTGHTHLFKFKLCTRKKSNLLNILLWVLWETGSPAHQRQHPSLDPHQFAFRADRSWEDAFSTTLHSHTLKITTPTSECCLLISAQQSTQTCQWKWLAILALWVWVPHCNWKLDFLKNRPETVWFGVHTSSTLVLNTGASQGCVVSPLLFKL